jgi:hypothetical protein
MQIQDLKTTREYLVGELRRNPNRRLSSLFRDLRRQGRISLIGDYPLIFYVLITALESSISYSRREINYTFYFSEDLSSLNKGEKTKLLDQLFSLSSGGLKQAKNFVRRKEM